MWTASPVAIPLISHRKDTKRRGRAQDWASNMELCRLDWGQESCQP